MHLFKKGECIAGQSQASGLASFFNETGWPRVGQRILYKKKNMFHITWYERPHWMSHIDTCVRLISHEIILPWHLSRNPLDSTVKSYCKTTQIKLPTHRTFLRGECILGQSLPTWYIQCGIPHKLHINMLHATANRHTGLYMPLWRIIAYIGGSGNTTHPKIHAKLILDLQTRFKYGFTINTARLTCNQWVSNTIIVSVAPLKTFRHIWKEQKIAKNSSSKLQSSLMSHWSS